MAEELWIVVGLGNPGPRYERTRHNIGFMAVDLLGREMPWRSSSRFSCELAKGELSRRPVVLVKPQTFMNLSGEAVGPLARFYGVEAERVVVIHDDIDLEPGRLKVKVGGGDGGHKGIRSLAQHLGGEFFRVRCGVGRPPYGDAVAWVLQAFGEEELPVLQEQLQRAGKAARCLITRGLREASNRFNRAPAAAPAGDGGRPGAGAGAERGEGEND